MWYNFPASLVLIFSHFSDLTFFFSFFFKKQSLNLYGLFDSDVYLIVMFKGNSIVPPLFLGVRYPLLSNLLYQVIKTSHLMVLSSHLMVLSSHYVVLTSHMIVLLSHSMVPLFFFSHLMVLSLYWIVLTSYVTVLLSHLVVPLFFSHIWWHHPHIL